MHSTAFSLKPVKAVYHSLGLYMAMAVGLVVVYCVTKWGGSERKRALLSIYFHSTSRCCLCLYCIRIRIRKQNQCEGCAVYGPMCRVCILSHVVAGGP